MSYSKMAELLLQETMRKAQIPGVSMAFLDREGDITTQEKGLTDGFGLFKMTHDPTQCPFKDLGLGTKNAVVSFNDDLYYVNQSERSVQKIQLTDTNKTAFETLRTKCSDVYKLAELDDYKLITPLTGFPQPTDVKPDTDFGAASLSKPVFAYLVQKLIQANAANQAESKTGKFNLDKFNLNKFDLDTPLFHILPLEEFSFGKMKFDMSDSSAVASAKTLTARMVLSHMTGLDHEEIKFQFKPEEQAHGYSNVGIFYLQRVIEKLTGSNLETLAKQHVFEPCGMQKSTYGSEPCAANTLRTTATDYANFVKHLINDNTVENPFTPHVFMTKDKGLAGPLGVAAGKIDDTILNHVAWGLGWGLQTDKEGKEIITAYHSGDMNDCRAWVAINVKDKSAVVFFANSHNGHILAEQIIPKTIQMDEAANYFFPKWGFARNLAELGENINKFGENSTPKPEPAISQKFSDAASIQQALSEGKKETHTIRQKEKPPMPKETEQTDMHKSSITPLQTTPKPPWEQ